MASFTGDAGADAMPEAGFASIMHIDTPPLLKRVIKQPKRYAEDTWENSLRKYSQSVIKKPKSAKKVAEKSSALPIALGKVALVKKKLSKNKITVGYATNDALYKDIIGMLLAGMSISSITTVLCNSNNKYREILTQNARPDNECRIAKEAGAEGLTDYKNAQDRNIRKDAYDVDDSKKNLINSVLAVNGLKRPFYLAMVLDKTKGKKRMTSVPFTPSHMGDCGNCWLCNLPVHYYWQYEKGYTNTTGCGDCEHVGAIVAAFLAGMLSNQGNPDQFVFNYHPSHPHCNKWKSNTIPMKFNKNSGQWELDSKGISTIAKDIATSPVHGSEYCPLFIKAYNEKKITVDNVKTYINRPATEWCKAANGLLTTYINQKKANIASALASIIAKTAPKLITTTKMDSAEKINLKRVKGGSGSGYSSFITDADDMEDDNDDSVYIKDIDEYCILKPELNDEQIGQLQQEYDAIFIDEDVNDDDSADDDVKKRANSVARNTAIECLFRLFNNMEDPANRGHGVNGIRNILTNANTNINQLLPDLKTYISRRIDFITTIVNEKDMMLDDGIEAEDLDLDDSEYAVVDNIDIKEENVNEFEEVSRKFAKVGTDAKYETQPSSPPSQVIGVKSALVGIFDTPAKPRSTQVINTVTPGSGIPLPGLINDSDTPEEDDPEITSITDSMDTSKEDDTSRPPSVNRKVGDQDTQEDDAVITGITDTMDTSKEDDTSRPPSVKRKVGDQDTQEDDAEITGITYRMDTSKGDDASRPPSIKMAKTDSRPASGRESVPIEYYNTPGGSRLNKRQSKKKSQKRNQKNKTKRISYIKHKQTRKNKHSKKTKSKRSNKK